MTTLAKPIRSLELITVLIGEARIHLSLEFDTRLEMTENLDALEQDFKRKIQDVTKIEADEARYCILGDLRYANETLSRIFVVAVLNPYIHDKDFPYIATDTNGILSLGKPHQDVNNVASTAHVRTGVSRRRNQPMAEV